MVHICPEMAIYTTSLQKYFGLESSAYNKLRNRTLQSGPWVSMCIYWAIQHCLPRYLGTSIRSFSKWSWLCMSIQNNCAVYRKFAASLPFPQAVCCPISSDAGDAGQGWPYTSATSVILCIPAIRGQAIRNASHTRSQAGDSSNQIPMAWLVCRPERQCANSISRRCEVVVSSETFTGPSKLKTIRIQGLARGAELEIPARYIYILRRIYTKSSTVPPTPSSMCVDFSLPRRLRPLRTDSSRRATSVDQADISTIRRYSAA
jgi:hypothetical protein